jgi:hypothetical protein
VLVHEKLEPQRIWNPNQTSKSPTPKPSIERIELTRERAPEIEGIKAICLEILVFKRTLLQRELFLNDKFFVRTFSDQKNSSLMAPLDPMREFSFAVYIFL